MKLALDFLLLILVELPILVLFFKRKKRQNAVYMGLLINIISWAVAHVIFFSSDVNIYYIQGLVIIGEAIAFNKVLEVSWKKAIIMSLVLNILSFVVSLLIPLDDLVNSRPELIQSSGVYNP